MVFKSKSTAETWKLAGNLAQKITKSKPARHAILIALEGELGAGKTTFVKGFARALGIKEKISSPTFVILKKFTLSKVKSLKSKAKPKQNPSGFRPSSFSFSHLVHIDAYRLRDHHDLIPLGIKEIFADPRNIVLIEWAERVRKTLPRRYIKVHIDHISKETRKIKILNPNL